MSETGTKRPISDVRRLAANDAQLDIKRTAQFENAPDRTSTSNCGGGGSREVQMTEQAPGHVIVRHADFARR